MSETFTREVVFKLTEEEVYERGQMLAAREQDLEKNKLDAKESQSRFGKEKKKIEDGIRNLAAAVRTKQEKRPVSCEDRANPRLFRIETVRLDTGEVLDVRPMNDEELADAQQGTLFTQGAEGHAHTEDAPGDAPAEGTDPDRVACPGTDVTLGCAGEECTLCGGALFVPLQAEAEEGTEITEPGKLVGEDEGTKPTKARRSSKGSAAGAAH